MSTKVNKQTKGAYISQFKSKYPVSFFLIIFIIIFFFSYRLLYIGFIANTLHPLLIKITAFLPYKILSLFDKQVFLVSNSTIVSPNFSLEVIIDCCAIEPTLIFASAVISFPVATIKNKFYGLLIVLPIIFTLNLFRIVTLYLSGSYFNLHFMQRMHLDIWQGIFILISAALFFLWLKRSNRLSKPKDNG